MKEKKAKVEGEELKRSLEYANATNRLLRYAKEGMLTPRDVKGLLNRMFPEFRSETSLLEIMAPGNKQHNNRRVKMKDGKEHLKNVTLNRNGQTHANNHEVSVLKAGQFKVGQHVKLAIKGDCCYGKSGYHEYEVVSVEPTDRFGGGRETVTFVRVKEGGAK